MGRFCVAVLVLLVLKFSLPCPEECFRKNLRGSTSPNCQCPQSSKSCFQRRNGLTVAADSVCSAENHGLTCLNGVPTGFNQSVIGILLNNLLNLTTLTKHDIPPLRSLNRFVISGSTIQAIEAGAFSSVPAIQWITIRCSRLQHIGEDTFQNLPSLKTIYLDHNLIETVSPRAFVGLNNLNLMSLKENQLKKIPVETLSLVRHNTTAAWLNVYLENNQIFTILERNFKKIVDTRLSIYLKGNPFVCDGRMRWLVCDPEYLSLGVLVQAGHYQCSSRSDLVGFGTSFFCSSTEPTATFPPTAMTEATKTRENHTGTTEQARTTTSGTMDSTRGIALEKNLDDGQQSRTDYIYMPIALTVGVIVLLGGATGLGMIYKRRVSKGRQNPVHGQQGAIISSQLIRNRMYQPSGSATGDDRDKEETKETEEDSARQNPVHKLHGFTIDTSQMISNRMYTSSASSASCANQGRETTEGPEENSELTPYLTVPLDAINNDLRIEPYSSVDLDDISSNEDMNDDLGPSRGNLEAKDEDDMEPYSITPLDGIGDP
ncbi:PREDICTED: uncharacterized protein LOC109468452 [Branchiostoma belcheri]|uniref:Uncharacterized protein LOC109468452 n=1 Tax=Branchiostoma belcheri TaxID=7741 RepID=A0A6P4Y044_BRABE|nr:PREDICTED: uncharacterized protein LOC109468452 [Branchiostoma belcheri]